MNPLAKSPQYNDLRFPSSLFLSGLKIDKLDSTQIDREERIVDRGRQFSCIPRFVPQQSVEGAQEPDIVDYEVCASSFRHECEHPKGDHWRGRRTTDQCLCGPRAKRVK